MVRIIPCLDCKDGKIFKGVGFKGLAECGDPAERAALYQETGADEIVLLDIVASIEDRKTQLETIKKVREVLFIPLTAGGGVSSLKDFERLLKAGADKVTINTQAFLNPNLISDAAEEFGSQCVVVAIDADKEVLIKGGTVRTGKDVKDWALECEARGAGEILLTSYSLDGTGLGYDLNLISSLHLNIPVIASGGAKEISHFQSAFDAGADAALAASVFHFDMLTPNQIKKQIVNFEVRL